ncbi:MAG: hypothetical protein Sylvanvirus3_13 [Sylvanvirus sp.]|uniref:Uncharacterized protein n=1 Tax=Sylvanvirus sp. TaxID=2487774 RepID=A0A3G5AKT4_9VIRU|nr:MAG: hypothetical protein Sylvanvirus3_13 [Sylvanvirus sp.]
MTSTFRTRKNAYTVTAEILHRNDMEETEEILIDHVPDYGFKNVINLVTLYIGSTPFEMSVKQAESRGNKTSSLQELHILTKYVKTDSEFERYYFNIQGSPEDIKKLDGYFSKLQ